MIRLLTTFFLSLLMAALAGRAAMAQDEAAPAQAGPGPADAAPDPENIWNLDLSTGGRVTILLRPDKAPAAVERIRTLTRQGFYDNTIFHRVIDGFMAQGGDPKGTGEGGSSLPDLKAEFNDLPHLRGTVSMARADSPDSANSQFFIAFGPVFALDGKYTVVGRVMSGMEFVDKIARGEPPANPSRVIKASMEADKVPPPPFAALAESTPADGKGAAAAAAATLFDPGAAPATMLSPGGDATAEAPIPTGDSPAAEPAGEATGQPVPESAPQPAAQPVEPPVSEATGAATTRPAADSERQPDLAR